MAQAVFHCDLDLSSIEVTVESGSFRGRGWVRLLSKDIPRIRQFLEHLATYPFDRCAILLQDEGGIGLTVYQADRVGHLRVQIDVSEGNRDGANYARISIDLDHQALLQFRSRLELMVDGQLGEFTVKQSTT